MRRSVISAIVSSTLVSGVTQRTGLDITSHKSLQPDPGSDGKVAVSIWLARDPRILMAKSAREVA